MTVNYIQGCVDDFTVQFEPLIHLIRNNRIQPGDRTVSLREKKEKHEATLVFPLTAVEKIPRSGMFCDAIYSYKKTWPDAWFSPSKKLIA